MTSDCVQVDISEVSAMWFKNDNLGTLSDHFIPFDQSVDFAVNNQYNISVGQ
jgi:hypothetical protein